MKRYVPIFLLASIFSVGLQGMLVHATYAREAPKPACGQSWSRISSPNVGALGNSLAGVAVISANDVWAVGTDEQGGYRTPTQGLTEHWDGTAWSIVSDASPVNSGLSGVAAVATNDVWAVGGYDNNGISQTLIEHWDGTSWSIVSSPNAGTGSGLSGVAVVSSSDIWAVGDYMNNSGQQTLIEHWDGSQWSVVPSPSPQGYDSLNGVVALSSTNVWAVGTIYSGSTASQTLIEHWNGKLWKRVSSPDAPGLPYSSLSGVAASSSHNIWAVGYAEDSFLQSQMLIEHWNGTKWTIVTSPSALDSSLSGISALAGKNAWAVGTTRDPNSGNFITLTVHWNGTAWSVVSTPNFGSFASVLNAVMQVPGTNNVWAVGYDSMMGEPDTNKTLTEFYC